MYDVNTRVKKPAPAFKPEMLVEHEDGSIGIVVLLTRNYVHVLWLMNTDPKYSNDEEGREGNHHYVGFHKKKELTICPEGTTVTIKQIVK